MELTSLAKCKCNEAMVLHSFNFDQSNADLLQERLHSMGFMPGITLTIAHKGGFFGDPIAVRINNHNTLIALRKKEASCLIVQKG